MSLRTRLWLIVGTLVLVPIAVAALVVVIFTDRTDKADRDRLLTMTDAVRVAVADRCVQAGLSARALGAEAAASTPDEAVDAAVERSADYAALLGADGQILASAGELPEGAPAPSDLRGCRAGGDPAGILGESVQVRIASTPEIATAVVVDIVTRENLEALSQRFNLGPRYSMTVFDSNGAVVASTAAGGLPGQIESLARPLGQRGTFEIGDSLVAVVPAGDRDLPWGVAVTDSEGVDSGLTSTVALALGGLALITVALGLVIARSLTQPLTALSRAADRVVGGDLEHTVTVGAEDEVGRVSAAFNSMTDQLRGHIADLERKNAEVRGSLVRMGQALGSTHDVDGLLQVVLQSALVSTGAQAGIAMVHDGTGQFVLAAQQGMAEADLPVPTKIKNGRGVIGACAASGVGVRGRLGAGGDLPEPLAEEPAEGEVLIMPLRRGARIGGVIALYGRPTGQPFGSEEEEALRVLADQAAIAVDNVRLHKEAERLSMTDPLTGLRNFRYLSTELAREIERATRFDRPLAVMMLDLDHFKEVNDTHGHARGDAVLRELAARVSEQIREVDTLARYGGEEFVIVMPETTASGAGMLAERICAAVRREPFRSEGEPPLKITLSVGVASFPTHGASAATLMRAADEALYVAKRAGRDQWRLAGDPTGAPAGGAEGSPSKV